MSESGQRQRDAAPAVSATGVTAARLVDAAAGPIGRVPPPAPCAVVAVVTPGSKVSTGRLLNLLWVVFVALIGSIIVGVMTISGEHDIWIWARVVFSLGVFAGLLIFACTLLFVVGKLRLEE